MKLEECNIPLAENDTEKMTIETKCQKVIVTDMKSKRPKSCIG